MAVEAQHYAAELDASEPIADLAEDVGGGEASGKLIVRANRRGSSQDLLADPGERDRTARPRVQTAAREGDVTIEISDTGRGIPNEHKGRIFDPGFTTKGAKVGIGLGLSICYEIVVNRHQGRIDVSSNDKGTTFTITMSATKTTKM